MVSLPPIRMYRAAMSESPDISVVSLVPSWSETLMSWGVPLIGRTRFCIHPQPKIKKVQVIGGTKNPDIQKINSINPTWVIADKEENNKSIVTDITAPLHVSHVKSVLDMPRETARLAELFKGPVREHGLRDFEDWDHVLKQKYVVDFARLPGVLDWWRRPKGKVQKILYVIWKDPWMCVSPQTFIGSVLAQMSLGEILEPFEDSYPQVNLNEYASDSTLLLFSSEPFPFQKKKQEILEAFPNPMAFVDGESFSWFGVRSLRFLQSLNG